MESLTDSIRSGSAFGFYWGPSAENPNKEARSSGRTGPYEAAKTRPNYHILTSQQVTKLILGKNGPVIHVEAVQVRICLSVVLFFLLAESIT
jgi:hypothetical protein